MRKVTQLHSTTFFIFHIESEIPLKLVHAGRVQCCTPLAKDSRAANRQISRVNCGVSRPLAASCRQDCLEIS